MSALTDPGVLILIALVLIFAGCVKGALGLGYPAIAMTVLPVLIDPALAVTLLAIPIFVTNGAQFLSVPIWPEVARRFLVCGLGVLVASFVFVQFLVIVPAVWINVAVGLSLVLFSITAMMKINWPMSESPGWQALVGLSSGVIGGVSAIKAPIMVYVVGLNLPRDVFICTAGYLFFMGGIGLAAGTWTAALLDPTVLMVSLMCTAVGQFGFWVGARVRARLSEALFRAAILWLILVLGLRLIWTSLA